MESGESEHIDASLVDREFVQNIVLAATGQAQVDAGAIFTKHAHRMTAVRSAALRGRQ